MLCTHQIFGLEMEHGPGLLRSNPYGALGSTVDSPKMVPDQVMPTAGNPASSNLSQLASHCNIGTGLYYQQQQHTASNHVSVSHPLPSTNTARGSCKGKTAVDVPGDYNYVNDIPNCGSSSLSFFLNSGIQNWHEHFDVGFNLMDATNFNPLEHGSGFLHPMEGTQRSLRAPNTIGLQTELPFGHHHSHNHLFQGNYFGPTFQAGNAWVDQFGNNVGVHPMWNYPTIPFLEGPPEMGVHQGSVGRTALVFHPPSLHGQHQQLRPVQGMQAPNYSHHSTALAPSYGLPVNNLLHHGIINTSRDCIDVATRTQRPFPSNIVERSYRPHRRLPQASTDLGDNRMRILSAQDNAVLALRGFYATEDFFDHHRDMRLDIDNMSYEELLALEEQIGVVKTGLPEEAILKHLKTRIFSTPASSLNLSSSDAVEIGTCIICQVEYVENERVGTLHCGHDYHADCIKQWLLVKNLCPICKTPAVDTDESET